MSSQRNSPKPPSEFKNVQPQSQSEPEQGVEVNTRSGLISPPPEYPNTSSLSLRWPRSPLPLQSSATQDFYRSNVVFDEAVQKRIRSQPPETKAAAVMPKLTSAFGKDSNHCLCIVVKSLLRMGQLFGILPVTREPNHNPHKLAHSWKSITSLLNAWWIILNIFTALYFFPKFFRYFTNKVHGVDFYTNMVAFTVQMLMSFSLIGFGHWSAQELVKAWDKLHETVSELALQNFTVIKHVGKLIPLYLAQDCVGAMVMTVATILFSGIPIDFVTLALQMSSAGSNFLPNLSSLTFILFCYIVSKHFEKINGQLVEITQWQDRKSRADESNEHKDEDTNNLDKDMNWSEKAMVKRLMRLRRLHENLCESARGLEATFGLQMLAVFFGTGVSFVVGVYGLIVSTQVINYEDEQDKGSVLATFTYALESIFSGLRIILVVCTCQNLVKNANEPGNILNSFNLENATEEMRQEVGLFLSKVGIFPLKISAANVFELGNRYLASAVGNVVTYVLVLMQFRLDQPDSEVPIRNSTSTT